tara:strand:- start:269 stop:598 length:330 start_codon:yes stop_codon:yes gene_type:complete
MSTIVVRSGVWLVLLVATAAGGTNMPPVEPSTQRPARIVAAAGSPADVWSRSEAYAPPTTHTRIAKPAAQSKATAIADAKDASDQANMGMMMLVSLAVIGTLVVKGSKS